MGFQGTTLCEKGIIRLTYRVNLWTGTQAYQTRHFAMTIFPRVAPGLKNAPVQPLRHLKSVLLCDSRSPSLL